MLSNYLNLQFDLAGKPVSGFCMQIHDDFHETYAVVLDGYHSFCIWLDGNANWKFSKYANIEPGILDKVITQLKSMKPGN